MVKGRKKGDLLTHCKYGHEFTEDNMGKIRGILCSRCNRSLGWYEKCKEGIKSYLKE